MRITHMKTNHMENPLGFQLDGLHVRFDVVDFGSAQKAESYRICVSTDDVFSNIVYDSGNILPEGPLFYLPIELTPRTRYYWKAYVEADDGQTAQSATAWFETGKMNEPWDAKWITPQRETQYAPRIFKEISISKQVKSARVYCVGFGMYELDIDGIKIGDEYFAPGCNAYDQWIQAQTYDITSRLTAGKHDFGAILGDGWYKGRFALKGQTQVYGDKAGLICEIHILYADGTTEVILTDENFAAMQTPILRKGMYEGETIDFTMEPQQPIGVTAVDLGTSLIVDRLSPPVRHMDTVTTSTVITTPKNEYVLDFKQNLVGMIKFDMDLPKGARVMFQHGEVLSPEGNFYTDNLRSAKQEFIVISNGEKREVRSHFTFYGFRYVKISCDHYISPDSLTALVLYSDMEQTGHITTSNEKVNRLFQNALWGQRGNFVDVPTDCPQRDERLGWTGDAQAFSDTACFNMNTAEFFKKYLHDMRVDQIERGGAVAHYIPAFSPGNYVLDKSFHTGGACGWADAATVIPWTVYQHYGDLNMLRRQYPLMKDWVEWIYAKDDGSRLWNTGFHFADWLALDNPHAGSSFGNTPNDLCASAYYLYSTELTAKAAAALGYSEDARHYDELATQIRAAMQAEFITPAGRVAAQTQTASVLALFMDFCGEHKQRVAEDLVSKIAAENYHLTTGFLGTIYLCSVLSENRRNDIAYRLLLNEDYPSWLYEVNMGATTIWERWDSIKPDGSLGDIGMNSYNHYAYGSIVSWMYRYMLGINPVTPGFKHAKIAPMPDWRLYKAAGKVLTAAGEYAVEWEVGERLLFTICIPFDAQADIILPDAPDIVTVNSLPCSSSGLKLGAGRHVIEYAPVKEYPVKLSVALSADALLGMPQVCSFLADKKIPFKVNEKLDGLTLEQWLKQNGTSAETISEIDSMLANALQ